MEDVIQAQSREPHEPRCADCGIALEKSDNQAEVCEICGQPLCRDCVTGHLAREEAMICATCWEGEILTTYEQ